MEAVVEGAIEMLDADGQSGLTFRGLAAKLGGGVGSIYWYVTGKEDLLEQATDAVLLRALADVRAMREGTLDPAQIKADGPAPASDDPTVAAALTELRRILLALFHQMEQHTWVAPQMQREGDMRPGALQLLDQVGQQVAALGLTPKEQFIGATTLLNFVTGVGVELAMRDRALLAVDVPPDEVMADVVARWRALDEGEVPFVTSIVDVFLEHDDREQFEGGLDLMLIGLREQARR